MPLLDHFHPPLLRNPPWEGVHSDWASSIAHQLNLRLLPKQYRAVPHVTMGGRVEVDVATADLGQTPEPGGGPGGVATAVWAPARPSLQFVVDFVDVEAFDVEIFNLEEGGRLVAAVELVSPRNKDRPAAREAFVIKSARYLQQGVSLVVVDVVTNRAANLHRQLLELLHLAGEPNGREFPDLYAVAYRTFTAAGKGQLQAWEEGLAVGQALPRLPLWLDIDLVVPVDLEGSYRVTCEGLRIPG